MKRNSRRASLTTMASIAAARQLHWRGKGEDTMTKLRNAFAALADGTAEEIVFDHTVRKMDVAIVWSEEFDRPLVQPLQEAREALDRCNAIFCRHGRYGFDGLGLQAMRAAVVAYERFVRTRTPQQLCDAFSEALARSHRWDAADEGFLR
ncbi:hypothetical protein [Variovorax sp. CY25R-8]|uniref:hypothetical protein n=1 Tax=Variovorax sp. CY25R-8 TaxID=2855501 RepID=UPI0021BB376F|nr:hypothetical protein [Variovorax sp. CY25R-8]MCT8174351.1 hypothetical protein [Variovorax sp. CY25R-8]